MMEKLSVNFGGEILNHVKGRVSTEVDAGLSLTSKARWPSAAPIELYLRAGVSRDRVLIKVASAWEGIKAAEKLKREGIHCNLTLLFSFRRPRLARRTPAFAISPFVGRIYDWYREETRGSRTSRLPTIRACSPLRASITTTRSSRQVMGASFRKVEQIVG